MISWLTFGSGAWSCAVAGTASEAAESAANVRAMRRFIVFSFAAIAASGPASGSLAMKSPSGESPMKRFAPRTCSASNLLGKADRRAAAEADRRREQRIGRCSLGPEPDRRVAMLAFVVAELGDHSAQLRI